MGTWFDSERYAALTVGFDKGAEEFVAFSAGGFEVGGLEGLADPFPATVGLAEAEVSPPGAVVVPEMMGWFAAGNADPELGGWAWGLRVGWFHG
jgi:hypothetical protein